MTTIYFIRHAESDYSVRDPITRPLTEKGRIDCRLVTKYLEDKNIEAIFSSPFKRAVDTVTDFAEKSNLPIHIIEDFREQKGDSGVKRDKRKTHQFKDNEDLYNFLENQWTDFSYTLSDGECLADVQGRNIAALNKILTMQKNKNIAIGTHGMALSTIINYYDKTYSFSDFMAMVDITPWVVRMDFNDDGCMGMEKTNLFSTKLTHEECKVRTYDVNTLKAYRFSVVFARYKNKWLYCRAKSRDCYETAGGNIKSGETPIDGAKRELFEETGAVKYEIEPVFDFTAHTLKDNYSWYGNSQVFFAQIHELGDMPDYEMAEIKLFDAIPDKMRFPQILPVLYEKMQAWLNLQSAKDEIWDIYDSERNLMGRTHRRADPMPKGDYHLVVHVWLANSRGEFLITKRAPNKGYPNMWECTGGSAVSGDDSITAAIREVKEETGFDVLPENGVCVYTLTGDDSICDVWLFRQDFNITDVKLQENETTDAKYATADEIQQMIKSGEFIAFHYIDDLFLKVRGNNI